MERIITLSLLALMMFPVTAQVNVDSLVNLLNTGKSDPATKLELYNTICSFYIDNDIEKAKLYVGEGLSLAEMEKDWLMSSKFNAFYGRMYNSLTEYDTALRYWEKALALAMKAGNKHQEAATYTGMAILYDRQSLFDSSLEYYLIALSLFEEVNDKIDYMMTLANIGGTHRALHNFDRAVYYLEQAKSMAEEMNANIVKMKVFYDLGGIYMYQGETDKAIEYQLKVAEISREVGHKGFEAGSMQALATVYYLNLSDFDEALKYGKECMRLSQELGDKVMIAGALKTISNIYREQKYWVESEEAAMKAWETDSTNLDQVSNIAYNIVLANIQLDNKVKATSFLSSYKDIAEQLSDKTLHESIADMEVKYETEKKELQIASLQKEKQLYIWLTVAGIIAMVLFFGVLSFRHRMNVNKRKVAEQARELAEQKIAHLEQEKQLIATKAVLDGETAERSRLAKDLHDGLGGMLSVVKLNLKDIKTYSVMDNSDVNRFNQALAKLEQSIGEIRRVSHNMMPESLFRDGLKTSLESFCEGIPNAHFHFFGEDRRLESSLEILLYRCAYELINNAMKHANATNIHVQLIIDKGLASLTVMDDGVGFEPDKVTRGTGMNNIQSRVLSCNGKIEIHSSPGNGTEACIEVELPNIGATRDKNTSVNG